MTILYLINYAGRGGTEKYVRTLASEYKRRGDKIIFVYNEAGLLLDELSAMDIPCKRLEMKSPYDIGAAKRLAKICRENGVDVIHTQFPRENYIAILSKLFYKKPRLFNTSHLIIKTGAAWRITNKIVTPHDEKIFAVCNLGKKTLIQNGIPAGKVEVIHNGVDIEEIERLAETPMLRDELGIGSDVFLISTLTRYSAEKGLHFLVDTVAELKKMTDEKFVMAIAGDGDMFDEIGRKIDALGLSDVIYRLGYRRDTVNVLASSDLSVNLSSTEALSFAILESLASGVPVVATDVGGTGDIINEETDSGILVPYNEPKTAAEAVLSLMRDKEKYGHLKENAKITAKTRFSEKMMLDKIYSHYKNNL